MDHIVNLLALQRLELKPYEYYKMDQIDHYFIKTYDRARARGRGDKNADGQVTYAILRTESLNNTSPDVITGFTACDNPQTLQNLLYAYYHTGELRNKISHADDDAMAETRLVVSESDESLAFTRMKESLDFFIDSYEKAVSELEGKTPNIVKITSLQVKQWADTIRKDEKKDCQPRKKEQGHGNYPRRKDNRRYGGAQGHNNYPKRIDNRPNEAGQGHENDPKSIDYRENEGTHTEKTEDERKQ